MPINKIDFALVITATNCNPNGDPITNMPRIDYDGYGVIMDVAIKRKIRNRLQDTGEKILMEQSDRITDGLKSIKDKVLASPVAKHIKDKTDHDFKQAACREWIDVRSFGQVFAFKSSSGVSIGIRGPVSIGIATSLETVAMEEMQITKSLNTSSDTGKDSTTYGNAKFIINHGVYVSYGSIYPQIANSTGFNKEDADKVKIAMSTLFENDASAARPSGSMTSTLYWWEHQDKNATKSPATIHRSLNIVPLDAFPYFECTPDFNEGVNLEILGEFA